MSATPTRSTGQNKTRNIAAISMAACVINGSALSDVLTKGTYLIIAITILIVVSASTTAVRRRRG